MITKHDKYAYNGKMNRITFSGQLEAIQKELQAQLMDLDEGKGMELVNLRREARNELIRYMVNMIDKRAERLLSLDQETLELCWNMLSDELVSQYDG